MRAAAVIVLAMAAPAAAGPLELEAGAAAVMIDTPHAGSSETLVAAAVTATLQPDARAPIGIRLHASVGRDGAGMRVLGLAWRQRGNLVIDTGLGIASIAGSDMSEALRPRGLGLALDVRVGFVVGPVVVAAFALPAWVFASDGHAREAHLRTAVEAGISVGHAL